MGNERLRMFWELECERKGRLFDVGDLVFLANGGARVRWKMKIRWRVIGLDDEDAVEDDDDER